MAMVDAVVFVGRATSDARFGVLFFVFGVAGVGGEMRDDPVR